MTHCTGRLQRKERSQQIVGTADKQETAKGPRTCRSSVGRASGSCRGALRARAMSRAFSLFSALNFGMF
jgi:hypothetical protein